MNWLDFAVNVGIPAVIVLGGGYFLAKVVWPDVWAFIRGWMEKSWALSEKSLTDAQAALKEERTQRERESEKLVAVLTEIAHEVKANGNKLDTQMAILNEIVKARRLEVEVTSLKKQVAALDSKKK